MSTSDNPKNEPSREFVQQFCRVMGVELAKIGKVATQAEMGKYTGVTSSRLGEWRMGKVGINLDRAMRLVDCWNERCHPMPPVVSVEASRTMDGRWLWTFQMGESNAR